MKKDENVDILTKGNLDMFGVCKMKSRSSGTLDWYGVRDQTRLIVHMAKGWKMWEF